MTLQQIFEKCLEITMSKRQDYTTNPDIDNHENFKRSAELASWFKHDRDKAYAVLIGTKLARLGSLLSKDGKPNNESIEDTFMDLINYVALWMERYSVEETKNTKTLYAHPSMDHVFQESRSGTVASFCALCGLHKSTHDRMK